MVLWKCINHIIKTTIVEAGKVNGDIISTYKVVETITEGTYAGYTKYSKA